MIRLDKKYVSRLEEIKAAIQGSDILTQYLEEEEEEYYIALKDGFEPLIEQLHDEVMVADPLQIVLLEQVLCDQAFEGLFLPRILGYSVLRGTLNDSFKYIRPQEHFKQVLMAIATSSNFEHISQRIGQTVEVGFALSSDIWITNLIAEIRNKTVVSFLQVHKLLKYRDVRSRHTAYLKYANQFKNFNFLTANIPTRAADLRIEHESIINFLMYRGSLELETSQSVYDYVAGILQSKHLGQSPEHLEILMIIAMYFNLKKAEQKRLIEDLNEYRKNPEEVEFLIILRKIQQSKYCPSDKEYIQFYNGVKETSLTTTKKLLEIINEVIKIGFINPEAIENVRSYYNQNKGLSLQNECLRNAIFKKFEAFMSSLAVTDFPEYFELNKTFVVYMNIFVNEKFNQHVKAISMKYIKMLLKNFTVKRSKDYQDIKKFVSSTFLDLGFLNEKQIREMFKTKRKKAKA